MSALYTVDHHQRTLQRHKPLSVFVSLVVLLCTTANFSHCRSAVGRRVSLVPRPLGQSANSADHGSEGAVWRSRNNATLRQLYRAIIRENAIRQPGGDYDAWKDNRKKRPTSKSYGLLGIDNLDFTASTLDRARSRNRKPQDSEWEIAKQMSKHISTQTAPGQPRQLSMTVSLTDFRRMLDMIKAGR